jgi:hypothetical protein
LIRRHTELTEAVQLVTRVGPSSSRLQITSHVKVSSHLGTDTPLGAHTIFQSIHKHPSPLANLQPTTTQLTSPNPIPTRTSTTQLPLPSTRPALSDPVNRPPNRPSPSQTLEPLQSSQPRTAHVQRNYSDRTPGDPLSVSRRYRVSLRRSHIIIPEPPDLVPVDPIEPLALTLHLILTHGPHTSTPTPFTPHS